MSYRKRGCIRCGRKVRGKLLCWRHRLWLWWTRTVEVRRPDNGTVFFDELIVHTQEQEKP